MNGRPRYEINSESLSRLTNPLEVLLDLVAAINDPRWSQERACRNCLDWDAGRRKVRPSPPTVFRLADPTVSCHGCLWSYLDPTSLLQAEERLARLQHLERTWEANLPAIARTKNARRLAAYRLQLENCRTLIAELEAHTHAERIKTRRGWVRYQNFEGNKPARGAHG